ncbi:hypothetical protein DCC62_08580 [candidate division KSB1 bacterium]|nr:MAG: hypothetical protein DCC62_08580 [candidate division KSB1 bacterium]
MPTRWQTSYFKEGLTDQWVAKVRAVDDFCRSQPVIKIKQMIPPKNPIGFLRILKVSCLRVANIRMPFVVAVNLMFLKKNASSQKKSPGPRGHWGF